MRETPDIETSSADYAQRFSGLAGEYFLGVQKAAVLDILRAPFGKTILDVGGGHGQLAPILADAGYEVTVFGSSSECHARLLNSSRNVSRLRFITGDLLNLPFEDQSYDLVISVRLISHIEAWQQLIREFCRVARNTVVIDYPSLVSLNALTPLMFRLKKRIEANTRTYTSFFKRELGQEFEKNSFNITDACSQFFLPMFVHRALGVASYLQFIEKICAAAGLIRLFGSPVVLRVDRKQANG